METQSALSEFRRQLEKLCQTSPDSDFYLRQLLAYVNNTPDIRNTARISVLESQQAVDLAVSPSPWLIFATMADSFGREASRPW